MKYSTVGEWIAAAAIGLAPGVAAVGDDVHQAKPNVLMLVTDDIAEQDTPFLSMPELEALAHVGVRFRRAYASPTCSPARMQALFSRYSASDAGDPCSGTVLPTAPGRELLSLADVLAGAGYATAAFGKWHLGGVSWPAPWEMSPLAHGFQTFRAGSGGNLLGVGCAPQYQGASYSDWYRIDDGIGARTTAYHTDAVLSAALEWIGEQAPGDPWFAWVAFNSAHKPWEAPPGITPPPGATDRDLYELMVADVDEACGILISAVDLSETIVVYVSDNGTPVNVRGPGQAPGRVKASTFEPGIRVPMVWAGPGIAVGVESQSLVSFVDFLPTLAHTAGVSFSGSVDGVSIWPALQDPNESVRDYVWAGVDTGVKTDYAVVTPAWKYREHQPAGQPVRRWLFDLETDPGETQNLFGFPGTGGVTAQLAPILAAHKAGS